MSGILNDDYSKRLLPAMVYIAAAAVILSLAVHMGSFHQVTPEDEVSASSQRCPEFNCLACVSTADMIASAAANVAAEHKNSDFVLARDYIPDVEVELKYAGKENFTGKVIYGFSDAWLRYGTARKLSKVQKRLKAQGLGLRIWDAFRPVKAQFRLWEACPDPAYVSDPNKGCSSHSRGNTVDVTLVDGDGNELVMPTGFDDFSRLADRDYSDVKDKDAVSNAILLEKCMKECGFVPYSGEWWHFSDSVKYDVAKDFIPE